MWNRADFGVFVMTPQPYAPPQPIIGAMENADTSGFLNFPVASTQGNASQTVGYPAGYSTDMGTAKYLSGQEENRKDATIFSWVRDYQRGLPPLFFPSQSGTDENFPFEPGYEIGSVVRNGDGKVFRKVTAPVRSVQNKLTSAQPNLPTVNLGGSLDWQYLGTNASAPEVGTVRMRAITQGDEVALPVATDGWLVCDGRIITQDVYSLLYLYLNQLPYGAGFITSVLPRIPDLRGATPIGAIYDRPVDNQTINTKVGDFASYSNRYRGGEEKHLLTKQEQAAMETHIQRQSNPQSSWTDAGYFDGAGVQYDEVLADVSLQTGFRVVSSGGPSTNNTRMVTYGNGVNNNLDPFTNNPHQNVQPSVKFFFEIKY